ncbi:MAG: LysE family translocator [Rhizobiales bacterium]|nr:LysE family translocator [Hyphomicrobiales bacterium]
MPIALPDLMVFLSAALLLNLTPGNDMMFVLGQSIKSGHGRGIAASFGIATGSLIHLSLVALGVAVLLKENPVVFEVIRWLGVAYLLWIAWKTLHSAGPAQSNVNVNGSNWRAWRDGTLVNLLNPKVIVFMFAFLPPFIRPENGMPLLQLLILGVLFNIGGTAVNVTVALLSGGIGRRLATSARVARGFAYASSAVFVALALRLALDRK